jgi:hypothetical protein
LNLSNDFRSFLSVPRLRSVAFYAFHAGANFTLSGYSSASISTPIKKEAISNVALLDSFPYFISTRPGEISH